MLETEVDDDYFTPVANTGLANIFDSMSKDGEEIQNRTLKYIPPKPPHLVSKLEESKTTQCLYACALNGYEWTNNVYKEKRRVGFAILKNLQTDLHNMVLYDTNKTTLSWATISSHLEVTTKDDTNISYYDNNKKYWRLYGVKEEIITIIRLLEGLNVIIKTMEDDDQAQLLNIDKGFKLPEHVETGNKESDTDSLVNKRTKESILSRMANMGQSILPPLTKSFERTSDSSDTNESNNCKVLKHKCTKSNVKRSNVEKVTTEPLNLNDNSHKSALVKTGIFPESKCLYTLINGQLVPVSTSTITTSPSSNGSSELNIFISEQRVNNSELRINMNRLGDKIDVMYNKISNLENIDSKLDSSNFQSDIYKKLLTEYENKINLYEHIMKLKGISVTDAIEICDENDTKNKTEHIDNNTETLLKKLADIEQINKEQNKTINDLFSELSLLKEKYIDENKNNNIINVLSHKIDNLQEEISKNNEILNIVKKYEPLLVKISDNSNDNIFNEKVKHIMNNIFQTLSTYFVTDENYSGEAIKNIIGSVIKKITIETLTDQ